jgi:hypothetical protein
MISKFIYSNYIKKISILELTKKTQETINWKTENSFIFATFSPKTTYNRFSNITEHSYFLSNIFLK